MINIDNRFSLIKNTCGKVINFALVTFRVFNQTILLTNIVSLNKL